MFNFDERAALQNARILLDTNLLLETQVMRLGEPVYDEILMAMLGQARWQNEKARATYEALWKEFETYKRTAAEIHDNLRKDTERHRNENFKLREMIANGVQANEKQVIKRARGAGQGTVQ